MSGFGLCVSYGSMPDTLELRRLGMVGPSRWIRIHFGSGGGSFDRVDEMLASVDQTTRVIVNLNNECAEIGHDWRNWDEAVAYFARRFRGRVDAVTCGNELDIWHWQPPIGKPDPRLTPRFAGELARRAAPHLRGVGMRCVLGPVASGRWFDYLRDAATVAGDAVDWVDLHLYSKVAGGVPAGTDWQTVRAALEQAHAITGKPVICSEAGIPVVHAGGFDAQAAWARGLYADTAALPDETYPFVCYFAWANSVGASHEQDLNGFGLRDGNMSPLPAWYAFAEVAGGVEPAPTPTPAGAPRFLEGFGRWKALEPELLGDPIEDESGPIEGISAQRTTTGLLFWANVPAGVGSLVFIASDGRRRVWREDWPASREAA